MVFFFIANMRRCWNNDGNYLYSVPIVQSPEKEDEAPFSGRKTTIFHCNIFGTSSFDLNKRFHLASYFHIYQNERNEQINVDFGKMLAKK